MTSATNEPSVDEQARNHYENAAALASELDDHEYTADFHCAEDWKQYALGLGVAFRGLDALLTTGAAFPEEWVTGGKL
ncbi:hypothetical protein ACFCXS_06445 [Streptomyces sp. NPDC056373]|uniref:hypothetical protein n=1 Tax=Streptomyces sp. NPDC056373 TaxID=3345798 RepID=UPI0035E0EFE5